MSLLDILNQALNRPTPKIEDHEFDNIVDQVTPQDLGRGVGEAFRSDQTPPIGEMVGNLFGKSNGVQQAGALNQIISALGRPRQRRARQMAAPRADAIHARTSARVAA
jgi:hypothetical protein